MAIFKQGWHNCPGRELIGDYDWNCCACWVGNRDHYPSYDCWLESRLLYKWTLPIDSIPFGSVIKYVTLEIIYEPGTPNMDTRFYKIHRHLTTDNVPDYWYEMNGANIGSLTGSSGSILYTFDSTSAFVDSVQSCLIDSSHDSYFTLAIQADLQSAMREWTVRCCSVKVIIGFVPPGIGPIMITNMVHGVDHYGKEMSYVRGDDNQWDTTTGLVNQMPAFVRPPSYKNWSLRKNHIAEAWFYRFDSTLDAMPEKYQRWNEDHAEHYVYKWLTDYQGNEWTFRNHSEDVNRTAMNSQIEVYIPKDSLPFDYKDPWRVLQHKPEWS